jgi:hypothetical protein
MILDLARFLKGAVQKGQETANGGALSEKPVLFFGRSPARHAEGNDQPVFWLLFSLS